eukprot:CAMPEP_0184696744 /NCGR_PEP_ID=MMETSP0313-20130426/3946_1 /TAXON_ID=2792 /ORGANISM="Porphyridium aerugineum, Strain SAG 1380-2" /LENGTH=157 /DNA_ID=CAMNT_0027155433 /DNA_START=182 /DNA_END=655 /DNA_ORIENTATION=-
MMRHPNKKYQHIEFREDQKLPKEFKFNPEQFGTMKRGTTPDNFPLATIKDVWKNVKFTETSVFEREDEIVEPGIDFLELMAKNGTLVARTDNDDDDADDIEKFRASINEEDLEFEGMEEEDSLAFFSRSGQGMDVYRPEFGGGAPYGGEGGPVGDGY